MTSFLFPTLSGTPLLFTLVLVSPLTSAWLSLSLLMTTVLSCDLASQGSPNSHPSEELLKQPDYSDKIKQMLGNQRGQPGAGEAEARHGDGGLDQRALLCQIGLGGSVGHT